MRALALTALLCLLSPSAFAQARDIVAAQSAPRVALVIGNNDYKHIPKLSTAVADAAVLKRELEARNFKVVYRANATRQAMNRAVDEFVGLLSTNTIALVYYAGHGVQIGGTNYLIPVDLEAGADSDVANDGLELQRLLSRVSGAQAKFALAIVDACRNNPFTSTVAGRSIGATRGLMTSNAAGMMVMYSAGANQQALDKLRPDDPNPNGLFTRELIKAMRVPGLTVQDVLGQTRREVTAQARTVKHVQTPALYDESDGGSFYFTAPSTAASSQQVAALPPVATQPVAPAFDPMQVELAYWDAIKASPDPDDFKAYLKKYPSGQFADIARKRAAPKPVAAAPPQQVAALAVPPSAVRPADQGSSAISRAPGTKFKECAECPEMMVIPPGSFTMGSSDGAGDEKPPHQVTISRAFAVGIYHVTRDEYGAFVRETGRSSGDGCYVFDGSQWNKSASADWRNPGFSQTDRDPAVCASWEDAKAYVQWLNNKVRALQQVSSSGSGGPYRLLTEAEWEYAARAGTNTPYYWGYQASHENANYGKDQCCGPLSSGSDRWDYTSPAGSFAPNGFGLYDMAGNAWQWTEDCYHDSYAGAPAEGSAWTTGECKYRVLRGGS